MHRKTVLANGVQVVTEAVPNSRTISLGVMINASPQHDPYGQSGLAHLTEHAMFQGTTCRDSAAISRLMDAAGGQMGAFTSRDYTCFYANVLDEYATYAMDLLGDVLVNSTYPAQNIDREKAAILNEISASHDNPSDRVHALLKAAVWPNHSLGCSIHGNPAHVKHLTRDDIIEFVHRYYVPDGITLAATGNVDHNVIVEQAEDALWALRGVQPLRSRLPCEFHRDVVVEASPYQQAYFAIGIRSNPYAHGDRYLQFLLNSIIGGGMSSRLFRELREARGLVYGIQSEYHGYRDGGLLVIEGSTSPEQLMQVLALTIIELYRLQSSERPIDEEELWTSRMQIRGQHLLASENSHTRMSRLATQHFYFDREVPESEVIQELSAIDLNALQSYADHEFISMLEDISVAVVGPDVGGCYSEGSIRELLAEFQGVEV